MVALIPILSAAAGAVGKILRAIPPYAWAVLALLVAAYLYGEARADQREAEIRAEYELTAAKEADQAAQFLAGEIERNRRAEQALGDQLQQAAKDHAQAILDLEARQARTLADLRAGNGRLRQHWQACLSRPDPATGSEAGTAADAELRAADIGHLQGLGGQCDADLKEWQTVWNKVRTAVNAQSTGD